MIEDCKIYLKKNDIIYDCVSLVTLVYATSFFTPLICSTNFTIHG